MMEVLTPDGWMAPHRGHKLVTVENGLYSHQTISRVEVVEQPVVMFRSTYIVADIPAEWTLKARYSTTQQSCYTPCGWLTKVKNGNNYAQVQHAANRWASPPAQRPFDKYMASELLLNFGASSPTRLYKDVSEWMDAENAMTCGTLRGFKSLVSETSRGKWRVHLTLPPWSACVKPEVRMIAGVAEVPYLTLNTGITFFLARWYKSVPLIVWATPNKDHGRRPVNFDTPEQIAAYNSDKLKKSRE
jgi:hypothetical protein